VTCGGVITLRDVDFGWGRVHGEGYVARDSGGGALLVVEVFVLRKVICGVVGFMGRAGSELVMYQRRTVRGFVRWWVS